MTQSWNDEKLVLLANEMKESGRTRREVTLAICKIMFYEMNLQPASSSVHKITRFGSMTDIQSDIRLFWAQLRKASQITVNVAGVPDDVIALFSSQMLELWDKAIKTSSATFDQERDHIIAESEHNKIQLSELRSNLDAITSELTKLKLTKEQLEQDFTACKNQSETELSVAHNEIKLLREQLADSKRLIDLKEAQLQSNAESYTSQLQAELERHSRDQEYLDGQWKASMMQVEEARQLVERLRIDRDNTKSEGLDRERILNQKLSALEIRLQAEQKAAENARRAEAIVKAERDLLAQQVRTMQSKNNNEA